MRVGIVSVSVGPRPRNVPRKPCPGRSSASSIRGSRERGVKTGMVLALGLGGVDLVGPRGMRDLMRVSNGIGDDVLSS